VIQLLRKIFVYVSQKIIACYPEQFSIRAYPVIAMSTDDDGVDLVLIANDKKQFKWVAMDECTLASIDD